MSKGQNQNFQDAPQETAKSQVQQEPEKKGKFKLENIPGAIFKAFDKAKQTKGFEKIGIFFKTFWNEIYEVDEQKKVVSKETQAAVDKGVDETMKDAREATALNANVEQVDKNFYDEVLAMTVASKEELDTNQQTEVQTGLDILNKAVKGETAEILTLDQAKAMGSVGLMTLSKLKAKFPDAGKFKEALDKLSKISDSSNYPLQKLLSMPILNIFEVNFNLVAEGLQSAGAALGISEKGEGMKFMESFGLSVNDALKLKDIKENPMKNEKEVVDVMKKAFFPNSSESQVQNVARTVNKMIVSNADKLDTQTLTDLIFNIADADMSRLIEILTGKRSEGAKVA